MARVIAICKRGPLDGQVFSVELGDDGNPAPLHGRVAICGVLYVPVEPVDVGPYREMFGNELVHEGAFGYVPEGNVDG